MPKIFDKVGLRKPRYSSFDLSREQKLSCKMGELVPTYLEEVVPGDHFMVNTEVLMRLAPMLAPIMHRVDVYMHYFFVPNRIIWNQWEPFITGGREGTTLPTFPRIGFNQLSLRQSKLGDYLGVPTQTVSNAQIQISALPFRAYQQIYSDYYRDPNLVAELDVDTMAIADLVTLRTRAWEKDYFTSALPWTQRGPEVSALVDFEYKDISEWKRDTGVNPVPGPVNTIGYGGNIIAEDPINNPMRIENLEDEMSITIEELRRTSAVQRFLEKMARGGARYTEQILSMFGVEAEDKRLQRAEYLGGGKQPIMISEVLNTTGTVDAPQGDMAGHGISAGATNSFKYHVKEHGYIMGIMSVLPRTNYQQGIHRHWLRNDKLDYFWPEFANLGEQEVKNMELYLDTNESLEVNETTFGYQQRYAEYKYGQSSVHGDFRTSLDFWHQGRIFATRPTLNAAFMEARPTNDEMTRIFAVTSGDTLWCQLYHSVRARRPMPFFADPRLN